MTMDVETKKVVTQWLLNADQHLEELNKVYKEQRKMEAQEKKLQYVRDQLTESTKKQAGALSGLEAKLMRAVTAGNLLTSGITLLIGGLKDAWKASDDYSKAVQSFTGDIDKLREGSKGMLDDITLMTEKNKLQAAGVKITDDSYKELLSSLEDITDAMGADYQQAVEQVTKGIIKQSDKALEQYGIMRDSKEVLEEYAASLGKTEKSLTDQEKAQALANNAIDEFKKKAGELPPVADSATDAIKRMGIAIWNPLVSGMAEFNTQAGKGIAKIEKWIKNPKLLFMNAKETMMEEYRESDAAAQAEEDRLSESMYGYTGWEGYRGGLGSASEMGGRTSTFGGELSELRNKGAPSQRGIKVPGKKGSGRKTDTRTGTTEGAVRKAMGMPDTFGSLIDPETGEPMKTLDFGPQIEAAQRYADEIDKLNETMRRNSEFEEASASIKKGLIADTESLTMRIKELAVQEDLAASMSDMAGGAFESMAGGMWQSIEAMATGKATFAEAMGAMVRNTLMGIASQAAVKAVFYFGEGLASQASTFGIPNPQSVAFFSAAATMAGISVASGLAGVGLSVAMGSGGSSARSSSGAADRTNRRKSESQYTPETKEFAKRSKTDQTVHVNLYLGDPMDGSASLLMSKQITAQLARAA